MGGQIPILGRDVYNIFKKDMDMHQLVWKKIALSEVTLEARGLLNFRKQELSCTSLKKKTNPNQLMQSLFGGHGIHCCQGAVAPGKWSHVKK